MPEKEIIVIGASAGGIEALRVLAGGLPEGFPGSIFVVVHVSPQTPSVLHEILTRAGRLPAVNPLDHQEIRPGHIYVAPPDHHLLIERGGYVRLTRGPKENRFRPAVDPLFRSAARVYGPRVVGVILSGGLDDGTAGLWAVKRLGGTAVVQDPKEAFAPSMPASAMKHIRIDYCLPVAEIAPLLVRLAGTPVEGEGDVQVPEEMEIEVRIAKEERAIDAGVEQLGEPSSYACPECHGVLLQLKEGGYLRFRCHTGHAYSVESLLSDVAEKIGDSLWNAIRALEENVLLMRHLAQHMREGNKGSEAEQFLKQAQEAERRADLVRQAAMDYRDLNENSLGEALNEV